MQLIIYGAKSIALGVGLAIKKLFPECQLIGFAVSSLKDNPSELMGVSVKEIADLAKKIDEETKSKIRVIIATPETFFSEIKEMLLKYGFKNLISMDSRTESALMKQYFANNKGVTILDNLAERKERSLLRIAQVKCVRDVELQNQYRFPEWCFPIQVGSDLTRIQIADLQDNTGVNISSKNPNYCELTGLYWIWKNQLLQPESGEKEADYYGLFHYRRILDITEEDLYRLKGNDVDVILPFPTLHEPDIKEHHQRYIKESDWDAMLQALRELQPKCADAYEEIFSQEYLYNYNIIVAKKKVLADYCAWLFPILERTEELSTPRGWERSDRYIGYIGENLLTLYFMYHRKDLKIVHTGRLMLT